MSRAAEVLKPFEAERALYESRTAEGISRYRKGDFRLLVTDKNGTPIPGASVTVRQKTHDFKYGIALFLLDEMESSEKNAEYRRLVADAFNAATLPFYWKDLEPIQGKPRFAANSPRVYRRPAPDLCLDYCQANGIAPKAHCLMYDCFTPDWAPNTVPELKAAYTKRMSELAERYAQQIHGWEVTNETLCLGAGGSGSVLYREPDLVEWSFREAQRHFPGNELIINEAHCNIWNVFNWNRSAYYMQIQRALQSGAPIDTIGMQFHMFYRREVEAAQTAPFYDPRHLYRVMDYYAGFGKPLQITEVTVPAYSWAQEDEAVQAEILEHLYRIWFSEENMETIIYWNLTDGYAFGAEAGDMTSGENYFHGGLTRFDLTPKPSYEVIRRLFGKEWRTNLTLETGEDGASFRGFYGQYEAVVRVGATVKTVPFHLSKGGEAELTVRF